MATLDVIRRLTLRAKAEGFNEAEKDVKSLGDAYETSARRQLSVEKSLQNLERRFITGAKAQQDFEKVQRQVNAVMDQNPALQARANKVLEEAHRHLLNAGQSGGALSKQFAVLNDQARGLAASLGPVGSLLLTLGPAGLAAGAALGAAALGMKKLADESLALSDRAGKLLDLSDTVGLTTRQLQALEIAGEGVGFSLEDISTTTTKFAQKLAELREGTGSAAKALNDISPALLIQVQSAKSVGEALDVVNKQLVKMDDVTKKVALSRELFGKSGARQGLLAGALEDKGGIDQFANSLNQLDIINNKTLKNLDDLGDAFKLSMRLARQSIDLIFSEEVLKRMKDFSDRLLEISHTMREASPKDIGIAQLGQIVDSRLIDFIVQLTVVIEAFVQVLAALSKINFKTLFTEGFNGIQTAAEQAKDGVTKAVDALNKARIILSTPGLPAGDPGGLQGAVYGAKSLGDAADDAAPKLSGAAKGLRDLGKEAKDAKLAFDLYIEGLVLTGQMSKLDSEIIKRMGVQLKEEIPAALKSSTAETIRFHDALKKTQDLTGDFLNDFVASMVRGEGVTKSLGNALSNLGQSLTRSGIKKIADDLVGSLSDVIKSISGIAGLGGPAGAAIGVGISLIASLFDDSKQRQEQEQAAQQAAQAMDQANDALQSVTESFNSLTAAADGATTATIKNAKAQFDQLKNAAQSAKAAALIVVNTPGNTPAVMAQANANIAAANQAVIDATQKLADFNLRTINEALDNFVSTDLSPIAQGIKDLSDKAKDLNEALILTGRSAEEAAQLVNERLTTSLVLLANKINTDLIRKIDEASGRGWVNQLKDLRAEIADLALGGGDASKIAQYVQLTVQNIVDSGKLAGATFANLLAAFPDLTSGVREFSEEAAAAADAINNSAEVAADAAKRLEALNDRAFAAANRGTDLASQLARFDYDAQKQRVAEAEAGGQNIVQLEQVLAAERLNVVNDFEQERVDAIKKANEEIIDYLNGFLTGSLSPLSAKAQLDSAKQLYEAQLALAQSGDLTALQDITKSADTLLNASKAFYGFSAGYQRDFTAIQGQLGSLAGGNVGVLSPANDNVAAISAAGFTNMAVLLQQLVDLITSGNSSTEAISAAIATQTELLNQQTRFSDRGAA